MTAPHDLVLLNSVADLQLPPWVNSQWAVVRRCHSKTVPIGFRGPARDQRFASFTELANVERIVTPRMLSLLNAPPRKLAHFDALLQIAALMKASNLDWGPVGSAGYELATGAPTLHSTSDLDILIYTDSEMNRSHAKVLCDQLGKFNIRVDAQLETPNGAVALSEWAGSSASVALRTNRGPQLTENPWLGAIS